MTMLLRESQKNIKLKSINKIVTVLSGFLILSIATNIYFYVKKISYGSNFVNEYSLVNPIRSFVPQEDFIVNIQPLREELNRMVAESDDRISIYFEVINTGANISINSDLKIFPASLTKLPLAIAVAKKVENGDWDWSSQLVLLQEDKDMGYGEIHKKPVGTRMTIEELVREMMVNSDNTSYRILLRNIDGKDLEEMFLSLGLEELFNADGKVSAKEYTRFFRTLYSSSYLKRENSQKILSWMGETKLNDYLSKGIPEGVMFSHKIGEGHGKNVYSDAGIVYLGNRPYILSVMVETSGPEDGEAKVTEFMEEVSKKIYDYVISQ